MRKKKLVNEINKKPRILRDGEIQQCLEEIGAFWIYEGRPSVHYPHALLTSGQHSNGYVNVGALLKDYQGVRWAIAHTLVVELLKVWDGRFTCVVGADTSSTELAGDIAKIAKVDHLRMARYEDGDGKRQIWSAGNRILNKDDVILHIEELITTTSSAIHVREGIRRRISNPDVRFVPFLPVVVDRSDPFHRVSKVEDSIILPLLQLDIQNYGPRQCPYCVLSSQPIKPKEGKNWSLLARR
jgi:orotate phosphoribosyltransferase